MKATPLCLMAGLLLLGGCGKSGESSNTTGASGNPVTAPVDYLGAAGKAKVSSDKAVSSAGLNQTIKLFYAQEGRFPKDLNELVRPDYLNAIPPPPAGMQYSYDPASGVVKVLPK